MPECWVCGETATHRETKPPYEYLCSDHAISIDANPIKDMPPDAK